MRRRRGGSLEGNLFGYCGNFDGIPSNDGFCYQPERQTANSYRFCWNSAEVMRDLYTPNNPGLSSPTSCLT